MSAATAFYIPLMPLLSGSPSSLFHITEQTSSHSRIETKIDILSKQQSNSGRQCWSPLLRHQNCMLLLILNTNFIKRESKIGYPWDLNWGPPDWELNHNHQLGILHMHDFGHGYIDTCAHFFPWFLKVFKKILVLIVLYCLKTYCYIFDL